MTPTDATGLTDIYGAPMVCSFAASAGPGAPDIFIDGETRFCKEREVFPALEFYRDALKQAKARAEAAEAKALPVGTVAVCRMIGCNALPGGRKAQACEAVNCALKEGQPTPTSAGGE